LISDMLITLSASLKVMNGRPFYTCYGSFE
jgi:hypothetical protein